MAFIRGLRQARLRLLVGFVFISMVMGLLRPLFGMKHQPTVSLDYELLNNGIAVAALIVTDEALKRAEELL